MADFINIVLADDHTLFRRVIRRLLNSTKAFEVIGEASDGEEAVRLIRDLRPNVAILEDDMPKLDGIEAARQIRQLPSPPKVIILSMLAKRNWVFEAFKAGCIAYVLKASVEQDLIEAVHEAVAERWFLSAPLRHLQEELEELFGD